MGIEFLLNVLKGAVGHPKVQSRLLKVAARQNPEGEWAVHADRCGQDTVRLAEQARKSHPFKRRDT